MIPAARMDRTGRLPAWRQLWDIIGIPFRFVLFKQEWLPRLGWTPLEASRLEAVLPRINGRLLDIGAGENRLVKRYGNGVGVDVYDWGGGAMIVENTANLPFESRSFDTITLVAALNHIPNRRRVIAEANRLLAPGGQILITMIDPVLGGIGHALWWYSEDKIRGMQQGEVGGMWTADIVRLLQAENFRLCAHHPFLYRLNHLYIFKRSGE